jgi:hypothetical protein
VSTRSQKNRFFDETDAQPVVAEMGSDFLSQVPSIQFTPPQDVDIMKEFFSASAQTSIEQSGGFQLTPPSEVPNPPKTPTNSQGMNNSQGSRGFLVLNFSQGEGSSQPISNIGQMNLFGDDSESTNGIDSQDYHNGFEYELMRAATTTTRHDDNTDRTNHTNNTDHTDNTDRTNHTNELYCSSQ